MFRHKSRRLVEVVRVKLSPLLLGGGRELHHISKKDRDRKMIGWKFINKMKRVSVIDIQKTKKERKKEEE